MNLTASQKYSGYFTKEHMMGPNCLRLLDELFQRSPKKPEGLMLDLGCGNGITTMFAAKETPCTIIGADLWNSPTKNQRFFDSFQAEKPVLALQADASKGLPFGEESFDFIISVDAYHYFAAKDGFFEKHLFPHLRPGGVALIAIPGLKKDLPDGYPEVMLDWAGAEDCATFKSPAWWRDAMEKASPMEECSVWEMEAGNQAWQEWFRSGHEYALRDQEYWEKGVENYLTIIGICVQKKA